MNAKRRLPTALTTALAAVSVLAPAVQADGIDAAPAQPFAAGIEARAGFAPDGTLVVGYRDVAGNLLVNSRPPGGQFGTARNVAPASEQADNFSMAVGPQGQTAFMWRADDNMSRARTLYTTGGETPIEDISPAGEGGSDQKVAFAKDGTTAYVWKKFDPNAVRLRLRAPDGVLGAPQSISSALEEANSPDFAIAPDGDIVFVYEYDVNDVILRERNADGTTDVQQLLGDGDSPVVGLDAAGNATAAWDGNGVQTRRRTATGVLEATAHDVHEGFLPQNPALAVAPDGTATFSWADEAPGQDELRTRLRTRAPGGGFSPVTTVGETAPGVETVNPKLAGNASGDILFAARGLGNKRAIARGVRRGGTVDALTTVGEAAGTLHSYDVAISPSGDGAAVVAADNKIRMTPFDAAAPALRGASVPAVAERGHTIGVSSAFSDFWGHSVETAFGDGAKAPGGQASHAYAKTGLYRVAFTATDAAGHRTSVTRSLTVRDTIRPAITKPSIRRKRLRFRLSEDATVKLQVQRKGRKRFKTVRKGTSKRSLTAGRRNITLRRKLKPGRYRAVLAARDPSGNASKAVRIAFRVKRGAPRPRP